MSVSFSLFLRRCFSTRVSRSRKLALLVDLVGRTGTKSSYSICAQALSAYTCNAVDGRCLERSKRPQDRCSRLGLAARAVAAPDAPEVAAHEARDACQALLGLAQTAHMAVAGGGRLALVCDPPACMLIATGSVCRALSMGLWAQAREHSV